MSINPYEAPANVESLQEPQTHFFSIQATTCDLDVASKRGHWRNLNRSLILKPIAYLLVLAIYFLFIGWLLGWSPFVQSRSSFSPIIVFWGIAITQCVLVIAMLKYAVQVRIFAKLFPRPPSCDMLWEGHSDGMRLSFNGYEQFNNWQLCSGVSILGGKILLKTASVIHPAGEILEPKQLTGLSSIDNLSNTVQSMIQKHAAMSIGPALMPHSRFILPRHEEKKLCILGKVTSRHIAKQDPFLWWANGLQLIWLLITMIAILIFSNFAVFANTAQAGRGVSIVTVLLTLFLLWIFFRIRHKIGRLFALYLNPNALLSEFELSMNDQGFQSRTNGSHVGCDWVLFRDANLEANALTAVFQSTGLRSSLFNRELFQSQLDWDTVCDFAENHIPVSQSQTPA